MKSKLVLKRLSASDLTLFEHHFRNTAGTKQKAFNLDRAILVDRLYPALPATVGTGRATVNLSFFGPGLAPAHVLLRKVLKQEKNWRLDGELVYAPPDEVERYKKLRKGDFAILDFSGDPQPTAINVFLIAQSEAADSELHKVLQARYGELFSARLSMIEINAHDLAGVIEAAKLPAKHPVGDLLEAPDLEDAAKGGLAGTSRLQRRRKARGVTREELERAKRAGELVGRLGEELLDAHFAFRLAKGELISYVWAAEDNAIAPYDFTVQVKGGDLRKLDVKSTGGGFENPIHISMSELIEMGSSLEPYDIYRMYEVTETKAKVRIAPNLQNYAKQLLSRLSGLPAGVTVDSISVAPKALPFGDEMEIEVAVDASVE